MSDINKIFISVLFIIALSVVSKSALAAENFTEQQKIESHLIVNLFLDAVERGELMVLEQVLSRSMLEPVKVSYVYEIESDVITINIYSRLSEPMVVPHYEQFYVNGVSVVVDESGNIITISAHVLPGLTDDDS